jgi:hypothetical protein
MSADWITAKWTLPMFAGMTHSIRNLPSPSVGKSNVKWIRDPNRQYPVSGRGIDRSPQRGEDK